MYPRPPLRGPVAPSISPPPGPQRHPVSDLPERRPIFKKPMFRGMFALVDAMTIGTKALTISANQSVEESEQLSGKAMGGSLAVALLLFIGVFIVLPNLALTAAQGPLGSGLLYHLVEGVVRMGIFLLYLSAISLVSDIRRVFMYHGAEHKTIAAWEHHEPLEPTAVSKYSTLHVRCGTNFLLMVMLIAIITYSIAGSLVPAPEGAPWYVIGTYHVLLRVILLPVVAGLAYEGLRLGAGKDNWFVNGLMKPGLWLQMITTKPPTEDQVEVAIRAFEAVVPTATLDGRTIDTLPSPVVWGPDEATEQVGLPRTADLSDVTGAPVHESPTADVDTAEATAADDAPVSDTRADG